MIRTDRKLPTAGLGEHRLGTRLSSDSCTCKRSSDTDSKKQKRA